MSMTSSMMSSMSSMTSSPSPSATSSMDHSMDMGGDGACKISMLWNWYTIDACFLSSSWHIRSAGAFAASCIGIALLVVSLELLRRLGKEYDEFLHRQFKRHVAARYAASIDLARNSAQDSDSNRQKKCCKPVVCEGDDSANLSLLKNDIALFRATPLQQLVRAVIHAATFGVAYLVMLLAMYYNGFVIISIILGAAIGKFFCDWMVVKIPLRGNTTGMSDGGVVEDATVCCG